MISLVSSQKLASFKHEIQKDISLYINGEFTTSISGMTFKNMNPFTNEQINEVAEGQSDDINKAVAAARVAFDHGPWKTMKLTKRLAYIYRIADLIDEEIERIAYLEALDTGLPISQTRKMVSRASENFRFYARMVENRLVGDAYQVDDEFINYTIHAPVGVAGLITPWNAPFMLETWKVAPALATGNTVVLKPAELSPLSANLLAEVIHKADLPKGVFNVVHGRGEIAGDALVKHPDVQLISFTGETTTGSSIIKNSADTMKSCSMELGGKSPIIVFEDADFDRALDACVWGIYSFNGERCTANSRLFLQEGIQDRFIEALKIRVANIKIGDPLDTNTEVGPLIDKEHYSKVKGYLEIANEEGTEVITGDIPQQLAKGNFVAPTLILNAKNNMRVSQEEIFGPILTVMTFKDEEEVIQLANDIKYGLAGYVWTNDIKRGHRVAHKVEAGMLWINAQNVRDLRTPFGGSKSSGIGREGGHYGFDFYTEQKIIHVSIADHHIQQFGKK
ncbi:5-carboxymethyl-2-hydroxymuconate semialdehyde dehydrogenase [Psychrobacillus sp. NPDC096426]|uniref:5-carboxymethyl-2-hydroxymuconate semialdehyde dehydrogenase n=1 Tax=Psychrobacillus sp. NPDC096426 TaxID=3364491 RepID=UPI00382350C8